MFCVASITKRAPPPPVALDTLGHRRTTAQLFIDKSSFEVSGVVSYPPWNTGFVSCPRAGVKIYKNADDSHSATTDARGTLYPDSYQDHHLFPLPSQVPLTLLA